MSFWNNQRSWTDLQMVVVVVIAVAMDTGILPPLHIDDGMDVVYEVQIVLLWFFLRCLCIGMQDQFDHLDDGGWHKNAVLSPSSAYYTVIS